MTNPEPRDPWKSRLNFAARLAVVLVLSGFLVLNDQQRAAIAQAIGNPASLLAARSPGERESAQLRQTKTRREMVLPLAEMLPKRFEQVLPEALAGTPGVFADADGTPLLPEFAQPLGGAEPAAAAIAPGPSLGGGFPGVFIPVVPGGGGGGGGGDCVNEPECTPNPQPTPTPTPTPNIPVPEPATWLLIIAGFFTLGGLLRSRRDMRARGQSAASPIRAE